MKLALFLLFRLLPAVIDDFPSVLVIRRALVFLFFNKTLKPGIAVRLYQRLYVRSRSPADSNGAETCPRFTEEVLLANIYAHIKIHLLIL